MAPSFNPQNSQQPRRTSRSSRVPGPAPSQIISGPVQSSQVTPAQGARKQTPVEPAGGLTGGIASACSHNSRQPRLVIACFAVVHHTTAYIGTSTPVPVRILTDGAARILYFCYFFALCMTLSFCDAIAVANCTLERWFEAGFIS